jgi:hypothetical protein
LKLSSAHHGCSVFDSSTNTCVSAASANVSCHCSVNVFVRWVFVLAQQSGCAHELARLAIATLGHLVLDPGFLQSMCAWAEAFNGADAGASNIANLRLA